MNKIAKRIRDARLEQKLTQQQLALLLGVSQDTISMWERGKSYPSIEYIIELVKLFDVSSDYLLGIVDY